MARTSAFFIKGTDVMGFLRRHYGVQPTPEMLDVLSTVVRKEILKWIRTKPLPKVTTWNHTEEALRQKFGGKVSKELCWHCGIKKHDVVSQCCTECRVKRSITEAK